jgi:hypothetical protein
MQDMIRQVPAAERVSAARCYGQGAFRREGNGIKIDLLDPHDDARRMPAPCLRAKSASPAAFSAASARPHRK